MYIYGKNSVVEALKNKEEVKKIYLVSHFHDSEVLKYLENQKIEEVDKFKLDRMVKGNHQGIVAEVKDYEYVSLDELMEESSFLIILDHIEDPHNFGAIIRSAEAAGVDGIIIPKDRSVDVTSTVVKVSAGAISNVKISKVTNLVHTMERLKKEGFWIVGTDMEGTPYSKIDYKGKIALVIGNEGKGIGDLVEKNCDFIASIPMNGTINSLNASVAAGIIIFEAVKQRNEL